MKTTVLLCVLALLAVLTVTVGCSKAPNDAQITSDIQGKLNADSGLQGKQLAVQSESGTVTLSGAVDSDAQREAAARYAASEPGVKQVINNLQVGAAPVQQAAETQPPAAAPSPAQESTPAPPRRHTHKRSASDDDSSSTQMASSTPPPAPAPVQEAPPPPSPPPPPPPPQKVTIPTGTTLAVRLIDAIDSETAQQGQTFHATLDSPLAVDGDVAIPAGYQVEGHVVAVQSAGKFAGKSLLTLQLDRISAGGKYYNVQTDQWHREGSSRGKNTAEKVGAGAAIGAVLGGLIGGGKGAAIGAASGGGIGGGVQAATKGQQIKLASETVLNFTLQAPVSVIPTSKGARDGGRKLDVNQ
jgi:hypothetical protein